MRGGRITTDMKFEFNNAPSPESFNVEILPKIQPLFLTYEPDWQKLESVVAKYSHIKNILVVGHGGSITGILGLYQSLIRFATKRAYFLQTVDPDFITELKHELSPEDTLVIAVSKSGETTTQIEALLQFKDYSMLFVTGAGSTLNQIAEKFNAEVFAHPVIGGRFTGFCEVMLLPALLCGLPVKEYFEGGRSFHMQFNQNNDAWKLASVVWQLEQKGFVDVFMPFYSHYLFPWSLVIVQLCHESFGKEGKGGTYLAFEAPESQHHTNQRFFGGLKNILGLFIGVENFNASIKTEIGDGLQDIPFKTATLGSLNSINLSDSMRYELEGTFEDAVSQGIPSIKLLVESISPKQLGEFLAFWQMYAVYSSLLRKVDPFDQPQVEASKVLSFEKRLQKN